MKNLIQELADSMAVKPRVRPVTVTASDSEYNSCQSCGAGLVGQRTYTLNLNYEDLGLVKICSRCRAGFDAADNELDGDKMYEQAMADERAQRAEEEQSIEADLRYIEIPTPYNEHWTFPRARG